MSHPTEATIPCAGRLLPASDGLWQTSTQPFTSTCELEPAYLYTSGHVGSAGNNSTFTVEFPKYYGEDLIFYARVIPLINGQPDCTPSNTATLTIQAPANVVVPTAALPPPPPVTYDIEITDFKPIHFPDYDYRYCVTITENPYYDPAWTYNPSNLNPNDVIKTYWYLTAPGTNLCPAPYVYEEPSTWEKIGSFLKEAVNTVAAVYNTLKGFVVDIIAEYNPICLQANLITESQTVKDACHAVAEVAVNAALTYVGLPPSLPNYDELIEKGKGELTDLIAEQIAEQTGVPCPEECKDLIRQGIDATVAEVESQFADSACMGEQEAHDNGIEPLCLPPEVKAKPMHEGQLEPAVITVQLTRRTDAPDSAFPDPQLYNTSCAVNVSSYAENNSWAGQQVFIGADYQTGNLQYWQGTPISGPVFKNVHVPVPQLAPGESTSLTFALTEKRGVYPPGGDGFWLPGREEIYAGHYNGSQLQNYYGDMYDDWQYLYFGSTTTMTAQAACSTSFIAPPAGTTPFSQSTSQTSDEWISQIAQEGE
ncbi:MAG: hypothetical protein IPP66_14615 [Anaerolineales bacterium]|nr:hypothetical protein [Anaerolineales bacterium]